jgi:insulysin
LQPHTYVVSLTGKLEEDRPAQWLLNADSLYREYSEAAVKDILDCTLPERVRLTLSAKTHKNLVDTSKIDWQKEKWYGTEYSVQKFDPDILGKVCSHIIIGIADRSFRYSAGGYPRVAPATP